ncbi:MAG TPA: ribose 5-phosphate isomerase B [Bacteroidales bacterium]|jgi:ribose 5-phosphate isomerase B|nr:MAG: putative sugar phosphate isomerase YwlF [Bacteroidetes bacterium ADurb.Bin139]HOG25734.1 ribose 5-phosphate isomerase B [Bacteroidales bacterium]HOR10910.1 ribose 5-phosphate isomerase B [Bacteroidales bacterium]HOZ19329.1 ribose 5-phosphate isomerase B [Bacteroidales bacterium]HPB78119.1 ribose 5-phosphate isomerase B [Bacteroidales bacterium]
MEVIALGSDHAAFQLKENIKEYLAGLGYQVRDFGTTGPDSVDYPDYGIAVGEAVSHGECDRGIVLCGTGIGISISANKVKGIRAAACSEPFSARLSREHNNSNVLALGSRIVAPEYARCIVKTWLDALFLGGRHALRIQKIAQYESGDPGK